MSRGGRPGSPAIRTLTDDALTVEAHGGRGAYLCGAPDCWTKGARVMGRALRRPGLSVTPDRLRTMAGAR
jgi:hypothetical protein